MKGDISDTAHQVLREPFIHTTFEARLHQHNMASSCSLPVEVWQTVNLFLPAQDVLSVLCVNRACHSLGESDAFWKRLLWRDNNNDIEASVLKDEPCEVVRRAFLTHAYKNCLPSVRWYALRPDRIRIPDREGHLACVVRSSEQKRKIIITGGFSDDETVCKYSNNMMIM